MVLLLSLSPLYHKYVAVVQWITSRRKNRMTIRVIAFSVALVPNVIDNIRANNACLIEIMFILKAIKSQKGHMINRILHSWSFHMKFMKRAFGEFHKFHMK